MDNVATPPARSLGCSRLAARAGYRRPDPWVFSLRYGKARSVALAEKNVAAAVGVVGIVAAWCVVHTIFSVRYADVYYSNSARGISFNGTENPRFMDFFYVGFIIMTYQVADTNLKTGQLRGIALC